MSDSTTVTIDATSMVNGAADTSLAPDVSDQTVTVTESTSVNYTIALDSGSDVAQMYAETDAPAWLALNQTTGQFLGTAPAFNQSGASGANEYVVNCKAANVIGGISNFTVTFRVLEQTYTNTKSLDFAAGVNSYLAGNANSVTALERSGNGSGASDAWTVSMWIKPSSQTQGQTLFYFGNSDITNGGHLEIRKITTNGNNRIRLRYGSTNNHIQIQTSNNSSILPSNQWAHVMVTYAGGQTGAAQNGLSGYYNQFKIYVNGVSVGTNNSHVNYGWSGGVTGQNYRFGRYASGNYPRDVLFNQMAIWNSDQSGNISGIYNGGNTQDLTSLATVDGTMNTSYLPPDHYYEIETSVTTVQDINGSVPLVGYNFTSSDLVTDAP
jgi:hypothetical protein